MKTIASAVATALAAICFFALCIAQASAAPVKLNTTDAHAQTQPDAASGGGVLAVAWKCNAKYFDRVIAIVSTDGGRTFGPEVVITGADGEFVGDPAVAVSPGGEIFIVWHAVVDDMDYDVFLSASLDRGKTFTAPARVNSIKQGNQSFPAAAAPAPGVVSVVWQDNSANPSFYHIHTSRSADGGKTFAPETKLSETNTLNLYPAIAAEGGLTAAAWQSAEPGGYEILAAVSEGGGFAPAELVPGRSNRDRQYPAVDVRGGRIRLAWMEKQANARAADDSGYRQSHWQIDVMTSTWNDKSGFSQPFRVNAHWENQQLSPDVAAFGDDGAAIAWFDGRSIADFDVYIAGGGASHFAAEKKVNESAGGDNRNPAIALVDDGIFVVWQDDSDGDYEIFGSIVAFDALR